MNMRLKRIDTSHFDKLQKDILRYNNLWCMNCCLASQYIFSFNYYDLVLGKGLDVNRMQRSFYT